MIRSLFISLIKKKNPHFKLDPSVSVGLIFSLIFSKGFSLIRGFRILLFGKLPNKLFLGRNVRFFNIRNIKMGAYLQLEDGVYLSSLGKKPIQFGNNVRIGAHSRIITSTSFNDIGEEIIIGNNVGIGEFSYLGGAGGLEIGDDCIIGQYFSCHPENHNFQDDGALIRLQGVSRKGIKIGRNCWIGSKVTILDGVKIGDNCVIAAGAVVNKSMPADSIIGGVPARVLKPRNGKKQTSKSTGDQVSTSKQIPLKS